MDKAFYLATRRMEDRLWWYQGMWRITERMLNRYVGRRDLEILDDGCGTGGATSRLATYGHVTGLDLSDVALGYSKQRGLRHLARASVTRLPFPSGCFDLVTSFDVLYHQWVDDELALREIHRVLRPGGHTLIRVAAHDWLLGGHDRASYTRQRYSRRELLEKLDSAGLSVLNSSYANAILFPLAAAKRLAERLEVGPRAALHDGSPGPSSEHPSNSEHAGDFWLPPAPLNFALSRLLGLEADLLTRFALPTGLSVIALAQKL